MINQSLYKTPLYIRIGAIINTANKHPGWSLQKLNFIIYNEIDYK